MSRTRTATASRVEAVLFQFNVGVNPVPLTLTLVTKGSAVKAVETEGVVRDNVFRPLVKSRVHDPRFAAVSETVLVKKLELIPSFKFGSGIGEPAPSLAVAVVPFCPLGTTEFSPN